MKEKKVKKKFDFVMVKLRFKNEGGRTGICGEGNITNN